MQEEKLKGIDEASYYKEAYEREHIKCADLAGRIAELEEKNDELSFKINRIKSNPIWKASAPVRRGVHFLLRLRSRLKNCGNLRGIIAKIKYKQREREAMESFGTASFPDEARRKQERESVFPRMVKFSILVPLYNTPVEFLKAMLDSVINQTYENWELCLADGSDSEHAYVGEVCKEYIERDRAYGKGESRILYQKLEKNEKISGNTNRCYGMATGEYIGLFDHDDILHPSVLYEYNKAVNEQDADYIYCDETTFKNNDINKMLTMHFKPDYAIDNLRANNYICHFSVFDRKLLEGTELFRSKYDGSQDHDMILRLTDRAKKVVHVPKLMYYWRSHAGSVASGIEAKPYAIDAAKGAVAEHLRKHGYKHFKITSTRAFETIFKISYQIIGNPKISIIISNKDHKDDLDRCITSILEKSTYDNYEVIIVENNSETAEIWEYYEKLKEDERIKIVDANESKATKGSFNYSAVNNLGVEEASGDYILLLNNDTQVITVNWMEELLMYAQREDVGAVGAKLYYENKTIQHAGVVLALGAHRTAGHSHYGQHRENLGYMGRLCYAQDVSAVTGACLMVSRELYDKVGGLDESFAISLNDVDFCLKLRQLGYLNVFTPFAELYHFESISRGLDDKGEKAKRYEEESARFRGKWKEVLQKGDPYYNPNFSLDRSDFSLKIEKNMI
ncbi:glycosyltransferase family 2 protein [Kineothrix sp. MB12-C1]|uniref:glycosyltransferase family 2 protein n=1 Tax=Kineothrix sp. MB12-C1 TaxID=3070215 RepID=UPI0027D25744|nr:glycosyltransferase family 2 protein [Kineothrix sp. MB12-C1]WMC91769.1 glycosyltransferase family 2 protein [Kineothrix sp. MB12-C1]